MPYVSQARAEARRRQIIESAFECFSRRGVRGTALLDICREARISVNTLYRTFSSKEEIVAAVAEESRRRDLLLIEGLAEDAAREPPQAPTRFFTAERLAGLRSPEETRVRIELWAEALHDPEVGEIVHRGMEDVAAAIGQALGESDSCADPTDEARALTFLWNGSAPWRSLVDVPTKTRRRR